MEKQVKEDARRVLEEVIPALERRDVASIAELSNHTIHNASVYQDEVSLTCAVLVYALSKIVMRCGGDNRVCAIPEQMIKEAILKIDDDERFAQSLQKLLKTIGRFDGKINLYVEEVIHKARVKKGSALSKHGISIGRAAELLGVTHWDIQNYIGQTVFLDAEKAPINLKKKYAAVRSIFP